MIRHFHIALLLAFLGLVLSACDGAGPGSGTGKRRIEIGLVAKSQSNAYFQVVHAGAKAAARDLADKRGIEVSINWATPPDEDAQKQAEAIDNLATLGVNGIAIACTDGNTVTPAINRASDRGIPVVTFDSDAPGSKRLTYIGSDEAAIGQMVMAELASVMGDKGTIAMLCGNETAPNLQLRRQGALDELKKHPEMKLIEGGLVFNKETPEAAVETLNTFQSTHPQVQGWAIMGGWPLFTLHALKWQEGTIHAVSVDALPNMLTYVVSNHVDALFSQDPYGMGYQAVELLVAKALDGQAPPARVKTKITKVTQANLTDFSVEWADHSKP
ncbi:MAG: substrate-binding domain-containing protein [Planctomycetes bacterium]|nr:substrate-binding domain-containing protein [Planctomycetota bacterium]